MQLARRIIGRKKRVTSEAEPMPAFKADYGSRFSQWEERQGDWRSIATHPGPAPGCMPGIAGALSTWVST